MPEQLDYKPRRVRYEEALKALDVISEKCVDPNWDSYGALPVLPETLELAEALMGAPSSPVYGEIPTPTSDGGIIFEWEEGPLVRSVRILVTSE